MKVRLQVTLAIIQTVPSKILKTASPFRMRKHRLSPAAFYLRIPRYVNEKLSLAFIIILSLRQKMPPINCEIFKTSYKEICVLASE